MNTYSRAMGRWLFHPYRCHKCKQQMTFLQGMRLDRERNAMIHTKCEIKQ